MGVVPATTRARVREATRLSIASLEAAVTAVPLHLPSRLALVRLLARGGRTAEALRQAEAAVALDPGCAAAHHSLGDARYSVGDVAGAIEGYLSAIARDPSRRASYENTGVAMREIGLLSEAEWCFREALRRGPPSAHLLSNLAGVFKDTGEIADAMEGYRRALALDPELEGLCSNLLYAHHYSEDLDPAQIMESHRALMAPRPGEPHARAGHTPREVAEGRPLRIGYVSPDVRRHSVAYFLEPVIARHSQTEAFVYSDVSRPDDVTARIVAVVGGRFRSIVGMDDETVRALIASDGIDVLVDLAGHTANNRLALFARRAAPVQVTWLGYPGTTGVTAMDYRLTDAQADPDGYDAHHTERLVRLQSGFLCYMPPSEAPPVSPPPSRPDGPLTFASFNQLAKLSFGTLRVWAAVLEATPGSRILLKARGLGDGGIVAALYRRMRQAGIDVSRVDCAGQQRDLSQHLATYGLVDVALDPFPYNGTTTTCEAMWMGVPTITLAGDRHAARVGVSLLTRVGLPLIAGEPEEYVSMAAALDADRDHLAYLRASLRGRMAASTLCDARAFTRELEEEYRRMACGSS